MKINSESFFKNLSGYKISNSHFELGSNLHIDDYYYAKRIFYNSFYSNRLAFIVANQIIKNEANKIKNNVEVIKKGISIENLYSIKITLVSQEEYSELLLSNIRKLLNDYVKKTYSIEIDLFNHNIYTRENLFKKNSNSISEKTVIFISPISTTFSTSIKIQNEIIESLKTIEKGEQIEFSDSYYNCILIGNKSTLTSKKYAIDEIEHEFGWRDINFEKRFVMMENLDKDGKYIYQHFLIDLPTKWEKINNCKSCFPFLKDIYKNNEEKCLIETKNNPVTPSVIFNYPKTIINNDEINKNTYQYLKIETHDKIINPIVHRKHFKIKDNHFIFYIRAGKFLKQNKIDIINWLDNNPNKKTYKDQKIIIITPALNPNSGFVNLVNEHLFSDTATIIQFSANEDYLYNFKFFYSKIFESADYILFVDDVINSTNTFSDINFFIGNIKRKKETNNHSSSIDGIITLINRCGYYNYHKILSKIDSNHFSSFLNINVAPLLHKNIFPFDNLTKKFENLSEASGLDEMRMLFKKRVQLFEPIDLTIENKNISQYGSPRDLFQFLITNELGKIFNFNKKDASYYNKDFILNTFEKYDSKSYQNLVKIISESESVESFLNDYPKYKNDIKFCIYKICSSEPFVQFKNIKESVFTWVLNDLINIVDEINENIEENILPESFFEARDENEPLNYSKYQCYCFLVKRAAKLKINFIYSLEVLKANRKIIYSINVYKALKFYKLEKITKHNKLKTLEFDFTESNEFVIKTENIKVINSYYFITFYVGLLQELLVEHEPKALQTVINVKLLVDELKKTTKTNLKNSYSDDFINLLRLLVYENTFIFKTAADKFLKKNGNIYFDDLVKTKICEFPNDKLPKFKNNVENYAKIYSFENAKKMLSQFIFKNQKIDFKKDEIIFNSFENMLILMSVLRFDINDNRETKIEINQKINIILEYCCNILDIKKGGAFFAIKYKNKDLEITKSDDYEIISEYFANNDLKSEDGFFNFDFTKSILNYVFNDIKRVGRNNPLSTFEISREIKNKKKLHFIKNNLLTENNIYDTIEINDKRFDNLFYLKITDFNINLDINPFAVICFYDNLDTEIGAEYSRFDPKKIRQLLLLRDDILKFINHHLDNDGLRAYIESRNRYLINDASEHGLTTYINQYNEKLDLIKDDNLKITFEILGHLLYSKKHLLLFIKENFENINNQDENYLNDSILKVIDLKTFKKNIESFSKVIFSELRLDKYKTIESKDVKIIFELPINFKMTWYEMIYNETIFEIFFNYRKIYNSIISDKYPFYIVISLVYRDNSKYISFRNNLYDFLSPQKPTIETLTNKMLNNKKKNGLSLINLTAKLVHNRECIINAEISTFEFLIPII